MCDPISRIIRADWSCSVKNSGEGRYISGRAILWAYVIFLRKSSGVPTAHFAARLSVSRYWYIYKVRPDESRSGPRASRSRLSAQCSRRLINATDKRPIIQYWNISGRQLTFLALRLAMMESLQACLTKWFVFLPRRHDDSDDHRAKFWTWVQNNNEHYSQVYITFQLHSFRAGGKIAPNQVRCKCLVSSGLSSPFDTF